MSKSRLIQIPDEAFCIISHCANAPRERHEFILSPPAVDEIIRQAGLSCLVKTTGLEGKPEQHCRIDLKIFRRSTQVLH